MTIKLYMHPVSTASRPVRLFIQEKKIPVTEQVVDLMTGEHYKDEYTAVNPSRMVPAIDDDGFRLTESSAILKYLASKFELPEYPRELKARARVDETMDWFNTQFYRDYAYGLLYPQIFPNHKRPSDEQHNGVIAWGKDKTKQWLGVLDKNIIGTKEYAASDSISIADYFGACVLATGEAVGCTFEEYSNVRRWFGSMKKLSSWAPVHEVLYGFGQSMAGKQFERV
jgi:glutathione S-transferase